MTVLEVINSKQCYREINRLSPPKKNRLGNLTFKEYDKLPYKIILQNGFTNFITLLRSKSDSKVWSWLNIRVSSVRIAVWESVGNFLSIIFLK